MSNVMQELLKLLDLEVIEINLFRGQSQDYFGKNVFGGQVLGQALMAAGRTVENRLAHSLHAYFLRPGDAHAPIVYDVERVRDGRSFTTRTVKAIQHGEIIFTMMASFAEAEDGLDHQFDMPSDWPEPESLPSELDLRRLIAPHVSEKQRPFFEMERPIDLKLINPVNPFSPDKREPERAHWMKSQIALPDDPFLHQCILAFASDFAFMSTAMLPHAITFMHPGFQGASIDHAMWFHRPFRMDEWLLYTMDAPSASSAKGMNRGLIYTRDGRLVASTAQEGLMRVRPPKS